MDRRKLKSKGALHRNLISSQALSEGNNSQQKSLNDEQPKNRNVLLPGRSFSTQRTYPLSSSSSTKSLNEDLLKKKNTLGISTSNVPSQSSCLSSLGASSQMKSLNKELAKNKSLLLSGKNLESQKQQVQSKGDSNQSESLGEGLTRKKDALLTGKNLSSQRNQILLRDDSVQSESSNDRPPRNKSTLLAGQMILDQSQEKLSSGDIFSNECRGSQREELHKRKLINEGTSRKRKSLSLTSSKFDSDEDLCLPLAESTVLKKQRSNSHVAENEFEVARDRNLNSPSLISTPIEDKTDARPITKCKFIEFLCDSGIKMNSNAPPALCKDIIMVQQRMKELLNSKKYAKLELIALMEKYFENDQNLENALEDMELIANDEVTNFLHSISLIKILLQVSELHPEIYSSLLTRLNEAVLIADSIEAVPWALSLLQQFRFLDVVTNSDALTSSLEQLLESCPPWFQNDLILFLPDIVTDKQHQAVADVLNKVLEENSELTGLILNCMSNLNLGKEYLDEYKEKTLNLLKSNIKLNAIPAIIKFVLEDCTDAEIFAKMLNILRDTNIQPLVGENIEECYQSQLNIINTLKLNILLVKNFVNATISVIKDVIKDPKPLDIVLLLLVFSTTEAKRKTVETIFKQHIRSGFYRTSLLNLLYNDYKHVVEELQPTALQVSSTLLKTDERVYIDFSIEWLRLQFKCHKENVFKQREILERMIFLMGDTDQTIKNVLAFLSKMVVKEEERQYLVAHCNHLRILLEKMDNLNLEEVGTLNDVLQHLCTNSSAVADSLRDDLFILLQKQLANFKPLTKCKGVLGAVMAIKHLMQKAESSDAAYNLFKTVQSTVKGCQRSKALFYDQLSHIISQTPNIDAEFMKNLTNHVEEEFVATNMIERSDYSGELVPKFGLNKAEQEPQNCVLTFEEKKYGAIVPITFKLLKTCCLSLSEDGNLDAIDSLLGCAILMPQNLDIAENEIMELVICCVNWFREVINGFVTQKDPLLQKQVLQRLDNLIYLQSELSTLFSLSDTKYQPSPCYFHQFPVPPFVRVEKKAGKKGKRKSKDKSLSLDETENWKLGSAICSKNPNYFRRFDATIVHLLDVKMELDTSQSRSHGISIKQVCFIVQELLGILAYDTNEKFIQDLIQVLPKICTKLRDIVHTLREERDNQNEEAARLLLCLLTKIFNWKGFESVTYNMLLREGLRTLASQMDERNSTLRSCKELVAESCKYIDSLSDIATQIALAISLVNTCQSLMKHSDTYTKQNKEKYAKMAYGFLCLEWPGDNHFSPQYKAAVVELLNGWINNEPLPLQTVTSNLEWITEETSKLGKPHTSLSKIPSITRSNFHFLFRKIFDGLIIGIKIAVPLADSDPKRIKLWHEVAMNVQRLVQICKTLTTKNNILIFLKHMPILLKSFLTLGMPILEHNLKYQPEDITKILKMMQGGTRYLHTICCDSAQKKDLTLTKYIPAAKSILERLIYSVKGMLVLNNSPAAFWMGNLVNKNLEGQEILSQNLSSEESSLPNSELLDDATNVSSDILEDDLSDDLVEEDDES